MKPITTTAIILAMTLGFAGSLAAQTSAPAGAKATTSAATSAAPATTKKSMKAQRTAKSLECSKDADAKKMHGKERRKFMSSCKRG